MVIYIKFLNSNPEDAVANSVPGEGDLRGTGSALDKTTSGTEGPPTEII